MLLVVLWEWSQNSWGEFGWLTQHSNWIKVNFKCLFHLWQVCCTSIVYATDKKHTKVEFPEARIYEETLQVLLYEDRNAPDQDLLQATSSYKQVVAVGTYTSDEEEERSGLARLRLNKQNNTTWFTRHLSNSFRKGFLPKKK